MGQSTLSRALAILDWYAEDHAAATAAELSSQLDIPRATLYRILNELKQWDLIVYDPDRKAYLLGPRVLNFARSYSRGSNLLQIARPVILELRDRTGETASLHIVFNNERLCVDEVPSQHALHWSVPQGRRGPLYAGAAGTVLLAFLPGDRLEAYKGTIDLKILGRNSVETWDQLLRKLDKIRNVGYAISSEEHFDGVGGIAAPILDEVGVAIASITVSAPLVRWKKENIASYIPLLIQGAKDISFLLSGPMKPELHSVKRGLDSTGSAP
jgi:DNA-binding IclR family transcriptional regulator